MCLTFCPRATYLFPKALSRSEVRSLQVPAMIPKCIPYRSRVRRRQELIVRPQSSELDVVLMDFKSSSPREVNRARTKERDVSNLLKHHLFLHLISSPPSPSLKPHLSSTVSNPQTLKQLYLRPNLHLHPPLQLARSPKSQRLSTWRHRAPNSLIGYQTHCGTRRSLYLGGNKKGP